MKKSLATVIVLAFLAPSCSDDSGDDGDGDVKGGTDVAGIPTSGTGGSDQTETSGSGAGSSGRAGTEPVCPDGAATEKLILVKTVEELAALSDCISLNGLGILVSENTTLEVLSNVKTISGALTIEDCGMSNLKGLNNLTSVEGDLVIRNCPSLVNLGGLENLKTIGGRVTIRENAALSDVDALSGLQSIGLGVGKGLMFRDNPSLPNCAAKEMATNLGIEDESLIIICGSMMDACGSEVCLPET